MLSHMGKEPKVRKGIMTQHLISLSQFIPAVWIGVPTVLNGGLVAIGAMGVLLGLTSDHEPDDPTDL